MNNVLNMHFQIYNIKCDVLILSMHFKNIHWGGLTYILHKYPGIPVYMKFSQFSM